MTDYYETLGVSRDADAGVIRSAYHNLAKKHHPDRNAGDEQAEKKFKDIGQAYEVLKNPEKRARYDQAGHEAFTSSGGSGPGAGGFESRGGFSDIFEDLMGGGSGFFRSSGGRAGPQRGGDLQYNVRLSLEEAFSGKQETIRFTAPVACDGCQGSGAAPGSEKRVCSSCRGHGVVRTQQGILTIETTCPRCSGEGSVISQPCSKCSGRGQVEKPRELSVSLPPGIDSGNRLRLQGKGGPGGKGGPAGDLYVLIHIEEHSFFHRDKAKISCNVPIPMTLAALGGDIEVPVIGGARVSLHIPAGTQSGDQFRLRGKGMPVLNAGGRRGDAYIHTQVEIPRSLSSEQKELLRNFQQSAPHTVNHPKFAGFFDRLKKFF